MKGHAVNYQNLLLALKKEKRSLLEGALIRRGTRFFHYLKGKERGITRQPRKIAQLARRKYIDVLITVITNYLATPLSEVHQFKFPAHKEIITSLPTAYHSLPDSYFYQTSLITWLQRPVPSPRHQDSLLYPTKAGFLVRSKEEVLISNTLTDNNIPHKYELLYRVDGFTARPDFTIKNPYTGKTTLWEHHGAFHVEKYGENAHKKIVSYTKSGLILNDTLIITYTDDIKTPNRLQEIIDTMILKV